MKRNIPNNIKIGGLTLLLLIVSFSGTLWSQERLEWQAVNGTNLYRVEIQQDGVTIQETDTSNTFFPLLLSQGNYLFRIHALDSFGNIAVSSDWSAIKIVKKIVPFVSEVLPSWALVGDQPVLQAQISGFRDSVEGRSSFKLENSEGSEIPLYMVVIPSEEVHEGFSQFYWDGDDSLSTGEWDFVMRNPDGKEARVKKAITVLDEIEVDLAHNIQLSWNAAIPLEEAKNYQKTSFLSGSLTYSKDFRGRKIRQNPAFENLGWDLRFGILRMEMESPGTPVTIMSDQYTLTTGLHYVTPFNFPINLLIRGGVGLSYSRYSSSDFERDLLLTNSIGDSFYLKDLDSLDLLLETALALRIDPFSRWFFDLGCGLSANIFMSRNAWILEPYAAGGYRW